MKKIWLLLGVLCGCSTSHPAPLRAPMRLDRVVLYQNGIGHFERSGFLAGTRLRLDLRPHEVDDVIKTLTVIDRKGEAQTVAAVLPTPAQSTGDRVAVEVVLSKPGRDLVVSYAVPTATWKATYRVALPEKAGEPALVQAWAMVDNVSEEAWRAVRLTLATGAPLSFATDLRTPHFVPRPDATGVMIRPGATAPVTAERSHPSDRDSDGIADADDLCAQLPEDADSFEDEDGCPDSDNDKDRVLDRDDMCPNEPETFNGMEDEDGCPDRARVVVTESNIMILDKIYFGSGSVTVSAQATPIIDAVAATLKGNPEIRSIEVAGHAANDESDPWGLSTKRAMNIRAMLKARGVAQQLDIKPYGNTQPLSPKFEQNRRVEFTITGRTEDERPPVVNQAPRLTAATLATSMKPGGNAVEVSGATRYDLAARVTVPRGASTLVSVLSRRTNGEDVFLFRPDGGAPGSDLHPLRAARIVMPKGLGLEPGPVAVFSSGTFAGEGIMERVSGGETTYIPYAVDGGTTVHVGVTGDERPQRLIAVSRGVAVVENAVIRRTTYTIDAGASPAARIFLRHTPEPGYQMGALPPGSERGEVAILVPVPLTAGRQSTLVIEERQPVERRLAILDREGASLAMYLDGSNLPEAVIAQVRVIVAARLELGKAETEIEALHQALADTSDRAAELQGSLSVVAKLPGSDAAALRKRLLQGIDAATAHGEAIAKKLIAANGRQLDARTRVQTALEGLTLEVAQKQ